MLLFLNSSSSTSSDEDADCIPVSASFDWQESSCNRGTLNLLQMQTQLTQLRVGVHANLTSVPAPGVEAEVAAERSKTVFAVVATLAVLLGLTILFVELSSVGFAVCTAAGFGLDHFLIAYSAVLFDSPAHYVGLKFAFQGLIALGLHIVYTSTTASYLQDSFNAYSKSALVNFCFFCTGTMVVAAHAIASAAFTLDPVDSGPASAVVSCQVLVIVLFFWIYLGETLTAAQMLGISGIMCGVAIMAGLLQGFKQASTASVFLCFLSMLGLAGSIITGRITVDAGVSSEVGIVARLGSAGIGGVAYIACMWLTLPGSSFFDFPFAQLHWPMLNAAVDGIGFFCAMKSYQVPGATAAVNASIFDLNSVVVLLLNTILLSYRPGLEMYAGMLMVLLGCFLVNWKFKTESETPKRFDELCAIGEDLPPLHPSGWGAQILTSPGGLESMKPGSLGELACRRGLVVIRGLGPMPPEDLLRHLQRAMGAEARPPPAPKGWPTLPGGPAQIHLLGSPASAGEYVPAHPSFSASEDAEHLAGWMKEGKPCYITDWHVDEPWERNPARFTALFAQTSKGLVKAGFVSTAEFWQQRMSEADKRVCRDAIGRFIAPPWLPQESEVAHHKLCRSTLTGDALYICADSLVGIEGMGDEAAMALCWRLTRECISEESVYEHTWDENDLVVIDNHTMLHARRPYDLNSTERVLWRLRMEDPHP